MPKRKNRATSTLKDLQARVEIAAFEPAFDEASSSSPVFCGQLSLDTQLCAATHSDAVNLRRKSPKYYPDYSLRAMASRDAPPGTFSAVFLVFDHDLPYAFVVPQDAERLIPVLKLGTVHFEIFIGRVKVCNSMPFVFVS